MFSGGQRPKSHQTSALKIFHCVPLSSSGVWKLKISITFFSLFFRIRKIFQLFCHLFSMWVVVWPRSKHCRIWILWFCVNVDNAKMMILKINFQNYLIFVCKTMKERINICQESESCESRFLLLDNRISFSIFTHFMFALCEMGSSLHWGISKLHQNTLLVFWDSIAYHYLVFILFQTFSKYSAFSHPQEFQISAKKTLIFQPTRATALVGIYKFQTFGFGVKLNAETRDTQKTKIKNQSNEKWMKRQKNNKSSVESESIPARNFGNLSRIFCWFSIHIGWTWWTHSIFNKLKKQSSVFQTQQTWSDSTILFCTSVDI